MANKTLVVDANILVRAILGKRVRDAIEEYAGQVSLLVPEVTYAEAEEHLPTLVTRRGGDPQKALTFLHSLRGLVEIVGQETYGDFEEAARERLRTPDLVQFEVSQFSWRGHSCLRQLAYAGPTRWQRPNAPR